MKVIKVNFRRLICLFVLISAFGLVSASAQSIFAERSVKTEPLNVTKPPEIFSIPAANFPETARKKGTDGTVLINVTLAENGQPTNIKLDQGLSDGISEAVLAAAQKIKFKPAEKDGKPVSITIQVEYKFVVAYNESEISIKKPTITEKPAPVYPTTQKPSELPNKIAVRVLFRADGTAKADDLKGIPSQEFNEAISDAAQKIKFQPAVHKKTKKNVSQYMTVFYDYKP